MNSVDNWDSIELPVCVYIPCLAWTSFISLSWQSHSNWELFPVFLEEISVYRWSSTEELTHRFADIILEYILRNEIREERISENSADILYSEYMEKLIAIIGDRSKFLLDIPSCRFCSTAIANLEDKENQFKIPVTILDIKDFSYYSSFSKLILDILNFIQEVFPNSLEENTYKNANGWFNFSKVIGPDIDFDAFGDYLSLAFEIDESQWKLFE